MSGLKMRNNAADKTCMQYFHSSFNSYADTVYSMLHMERSSLPVKAIFVGMTEGKGRTGMPYRGGKTI